MLKSLEHVRFVLMLGKRAKYFNSNSIMTVSIPNLNRSFSDPRDIQGLAHFLEHMVFMGTRKYPSENAFDQYIKRCAGFNNAETDFEVTSYYIEVSEKCLAGALDRFSQLFKDPLMLIESMRREREAVDSEFRSKMQGDDVRKEQMFASMGHPDHPCSTFSWGNLKTLRDSVPDDELYSRVHAFQKRHYSAHRMYVCIQAQYSLDVIQVETIESSQILIAFTVTLKIKFVSCRIYC